MTQRFARDARLRNRAQFTVVQDGGRRVATRHMTFFGLPNTLERDRLGIIASRRVGHAVLRNRAKRRLREFFRLATADRCGQGDALDLVVIARHEMISAPFALVQSEFATAVKKLRPAR